ncbi:MAG: NAD(P)-binding domain-containing protein, partial [Desulfobacterales bacterium]|nr:NAD(P)-binding domain-containing protein [Desulfobacterales bacterium]
MKVINNQEIAVGFIGLGVMGKSMALNLLDGGYTMKIYTRTRVKAEELLSKGALWQDSPAEVASAADIIITMIGYPKDVEEVYLGKNGILQNAKKGSIAIDMTTSSPQLAEQIYQEAKDLDISVLDAPVSG